MITAKEIFKKYGITAVTLNNWRRSGKKIAELHGTKIKILEGVDDGEEEIVEDLISIIHHYSMKMYSERRKQFNEIKGILGNI